MELVGYKLIKISDNSVVNQWGGVSGQCPSIPNPIVLPTGHHVFSPALETNYFGYKLITWMMEPAPAPIPEISDRQFFQQANVAGFITQSEALAAVQTGTIPASLVLVLDTITDPDQKFAATMILAGATTFEREHPLTDAIGSAMGLNKEQIDTFFVNASQL